MEYEIDGSQVATAQATETDSPPQQTEGNQGEGIQKRINELTAKLYEQQARADAYAAQLAQQAALQVQQPQVATPQVDEVEAALSGLDQINPEVGQTMKAVLKSIQAKTEAQVKALQAQFQAQADVGKVTSVATQFGVQDPAIVRRAQELIASWRSNGLQFGADDALRFAAGELALQPKQQPRQTDGRYAPVDAVMTSPGAPPAPRSAKRSLPNNFSSLSPEKQIELLDANGVGDIPL